MRNTHQRGHVEDYNFCFMLSNMHGFLIINPTATVPGFTFNNVLPYRAGISLQKFYHTNVPAVMMCFVV